MHEYGKKKFIGEGAFGSCYRLYLKGVYPSDIVVKTFKGDKEKAARCMRIEATSLGLWQGVTPRIQMLYGVNESHFSIITKYHGHNLVELIQKKKLKELELLAVFADILKAASVGVERKMAHNDIRTANVCVEQRPIIMSNSDRTVRGVLIGFDCSKPYDTELPSGVAKNLPWVAPELYKNGKCSEESDVYSLAILLKELNLSKRNIPKPLKKWLGRALNADPKKRPKLEIVRIILYKMRNPLWYKHRPKTVSKFDSE